MLLEGFLVELRQNNPTQSSQLPAQFQKKECRQLLHLPENPHDPINSPEHRTLIEKDSRLYRGFFDLLDTMFSDKYSSQELILELEDKSLEGFLNALQKGAVVLAELIAKFVQIVPTKMKITFGPDCLTMRVVRKNSADDGKTMVQQDGPQGITANTTADENTVDIAIEDQAPENPDSEPTDWDQFVDLFSESISKSPGQIEVQEEPTIGDDDAGEEINNKTSTQESLRTDSCTSPSPGDQPKIITAPVSPARVVDLITKLSQQKRKGGANLHLPALIRVLELIQNEI